MYCLGSPADPLYDVNTASLTRAKPGCAVSLQMTNMGGLKLQTRRTHTDGHVHCLHILANLAGEILPLALEKMIMWMLKE